MAKEKIKYTCNFIGTAFFNTKKSALEEKQEIEKAGAEWASAYHVEDGWIVDFNKRLSVLEPPKGKKADFAYLIGFYKKVEREEQTWLLVGLFRRRKRNHRGNPDQINRVSNTLGGHSQKFLKHWLK